MITIFDSSDLVFAIEYSRVLKLRIFLTSELKKESKETEENEKTDLKTQINGLSVASKVELRSTLSEMRNLINKMLDVLDSTKSENPPRTSK